MCVCVCQAKVDCPQNRNPSISSYNTHGWERPMNTVSALCVCVHVNWQLMIWQQQQQQQQIGYDTDSDSECEIGFHRRKNRNPKAFYQQMKKNNKTLSIKAMKKRAKEGTDLTSVRTILIVLSHAPKTRLLIYCSMCSCVSSIDQSQYKRVQWAN